MSTEAVQASYASDGRLYICFEDATGLVTGEGGACPPDGHYPSMVSWEMGAGSMLADDARALGLALIRLAEDADRMNAKEDTPRAAGDTDDDLTRRGRQEDE